MKKLIRESGNSIEVTDKDHPNVETSAVDWYDEIETLGDLKPKDRRSKEYRTWKAKYNNKIDEANSACGRRIFNHI